MSAVAEWAEAVLGAGAAVSDLQDKLPKPIRQAYSVPGLRRAELGLGQRRVQAVVMQVGTEDLAVGVSAAQQVEFFDDASQGCRGGVGHGPSLAGAGQAHEILA